MKGFRAVGVVVFFSAGLAWGQVDNWFAPLEEDQPDSAFIDLNGDGIDGMRYGPIFVAPTGDDSNPGTINSPMKTIGAALLAANALVSRPVYVQAGTYPEAIALEFDSELYGGYNSTWARGTQRPIIESPWSFAVWFVNPRRFIWDTVELRCGPATSAQRDSVGFLVQGASTNSLKWALNFKITASPGIDGLAGSSSSPGTNGLAGGAGSNGTSGAGGAGGQATGNTLGGTKGGRGGAGGGGTDDGQSGFDGEGTDGGAGGAGGTATKGPDGSAGKAGTAGASGASAAAHPAPYFGAAPNGGFGLKGTGGGGGGGGKGVRTPRASGGGGGAGGQGGGQTSPGTGGGHGGSSIGVFVSGPRFISLQNVSVETKNGGNGGAGGNGSAGAQGGAGGPGGNGSATAAGDGGNGGPGGNGGASGAGAGGNGGWSIGVLSEQNSSAVQHVAGVAGSAGLGGNSPVGNGASGVAGQVVNRLAGYVGPLPDVTGVGRFLATHARTQCSLNGPKTLVVFNVLQSRAVDSFIPELVTSTASHGAVAIENGNFSYTPDPGYVGMDKFRYRVRTLNAVQSGEGWAVISVHAAFTGVVSLQDFSGLPSSFPGELTTRDPQGIVSTRQFVSWTDRTTYRALTPAARGTFTFRLKIASFLSQERTVDNTFGNVNGINFNLVNGDADGDDEITVFDYIKISNSFGLTPSDPGYEFYADLDGDGEVTIFDYIILSNNFGLQGPIG